MVTTSSLIGETAHITAIGTATPVPTKQTDLWQGFFRDYYSNSPLARRLFTTTGVVTRHAVVDPLVENASQWTTAQRMQRYLPEALALSNEAVRNALDGSSLDPADIGMLVVTSCTGYVTPGVDIFVARDSGLSPSVQRLSIGHMGCHAALPGLSTASDFVRVHHQPALLVSVELPSLHVQPPTSDVEQMVAHALFSDAAVAVVIEPNFRSGADAGTSETSLSVIDAMSVTDIDEAERMRWDVTDLGFRMALSQQVPDVLERHVRSLTDTLLDAHDLHIPDIARWAVHPGGPRILDVVQQQLGLESHALDTSRAVLAEHGNCSSPTVLLVLDHMRRFDGLKPGDWVVAMAFGPGLTLYATLLQVPTTG